MGLYDPTPWAGLIALSGSIIVAGIAPDEAFPANLANRPVHAANGGIDPLYPSVLQKIFIDQLKEQGARIAWTDYPASGHDGSYMEQEDPKVNQFLLKTVRDPAPKHLVWETANPKVGRCDWVRIDEVRDVGNNRGPEPSNLILVGPPQFAIDPRHGLCWSGAPRPASPAGLAVADRRPEVGRRADPTRWRRDQDDGRCPEGRPHPDPGHEEGRHDAAASTVAATRSNRFASKFRNCPVCRSSSGPGSPAGSR